jgi:hypothetical protein
MDGLRLLGEENEEIATRLVGYHGLKGKKVSHIVISVVTVISAPPFQYLVKQRNHLDPCQTLGLAAYRKGSTPSWMPHGALLLCKPQHSLALHRTSQLSHLSGHLRAPLGLLPTSVPSTPACVKCAIGWLQLHRSSSRSGSQLLPGLFSQRHQHHCVEQLVRRGQTRARYNQVKGNSSSRKPPFAVYSLLYPLELPLLLLGLHRPAQSILVSDT